MCEDESEGWKREGEEEGKGNGGEVQMNEEESVCRSAIKHKWMLVTTQKLHSELALST